MKRDLVSLSKKPISRLLVLLGLVVGAYLLYLSSQRPSTRLSISFNQDVQPILATKCYPCHGPDDAKREGGLRLDQRDGMYATLESGVVPVNLNDLDQSAILKRITSTELDFIMPPPDFPKRLSEAEVDIIVRWIDEGGEWQDHWSYEPLETKSVPKYVPKRWSHNPIDAFIYQSLKARGLKPNAKADRRTLIRRLYFDMLGLPPSPEEVKAFVDNDSRNAYEVLIDQVLQSPHYGERWARHWLDVSHYGETHGYDKDHRRANAWPYRDYVIEAFNKDLPYGRFVKDQIAGDVLYPNDPASTTAMGFLAAGPWDLVGHVELREGTLDKRIVRNLDRDDMLTNVVSSFTGLTVQCARCHDHKFDPISQGEYYGMQSIFAGIDRADRPFDKDSVIHQHRRYYQGQVDAFKLRLEKMEELLDSQVVVKLDKNIASQQGEVQNIARLKSPQSNNFGYHSSIENSSDHVKWALVDLGKSYAIDEIILVPAHPSEGIPMPGYGFPLQFKLEAAKSRSFENATTILDHSLEDHHERTDQSIIVSGKQLKARFIKLTANKIWKGRGTDFFLALAEIQVISRGKNIARNATVNTSDQYITSKWKPEFLTDGFSSRKLLAGEKLSPAHLRKVRIAESKLNKLQQKERQLRRSSLRQSDKSEVGEIERQLDQIQDSLTGLPSPSQVYAAASKYPKWGNFQAPDSMRPIYVLNRGDTEQPLQKAKPGAVTTWNFLPSVFELPPDHSEGDRRAALAKWITDESNAFTWRSIVNRIWQYHFGRGLVATPNDFGKMGIPPTHPDLLDYLAAEFLKNGQSIKWLHRMILTSETYQQSSEHQKGNFLIDGENRFFWRHDRRRLEAEVIWDGVLSVSGKLDLKMGGKSFDTFRFEDDHSPRYLYRDYNAYDPGSFRRAIYRTIVRSVPDPFLTTLDCADPSQSVPVRNETTTALQALSALNNRFMVRQSDFFADRLERERSNRSEQIERGISLALQREATKDELDKLIKYSKQHGLAATCRLILALNEFLYTD